MKELYVQAFIALRDNPDLCCTCKLDPLVLALVTHLSQGPELGDRPADILEPPYSG